MPPAQQEAALALLLALAIGLLFGLERGWHKEQPEYAARPAGVRTFALIGLLGGVAGLLTRETTPALLGWAFAGLAAAAVTGHVLSARTTGETGTTTLVAELLAFGLAALATLHQPVTAAAAAVVATLLLGLKPQLHGWIGKLHETELRATLQLLLISVVLLPILPNRGFGPAEALNPYQLWWMVVLIAAISYVGYFAVRIVGPSAGIPLTGVLAGLASSTALTLQMARQAHHPQTDRDLLAVAILLANATLFPRVLVIVSLVQPALLRPLGLPLGLMGLITALPALLLWLPRRKAGEHAPVQTDNPLALGSALRFGLLLAAVMLLGRLAAERFGDAGVLALAAVSGVADLNAITLSVARMHPPQLSAFIATLAILLAVSSNTLFKVAVCWWVGNARLALRVGLPLLGACGAGLALLWLAAQPDLLPQLLADWWWRPDA